MNRSPQRGELRFIQTFKLMDENLVVIGRYLLEPIVQKYLVLFISFDKFKGVGLGFSWEKERILIFIPYKYDGRIHTGMEV